MSVLKDIGIVDVYYLNSKPLYYCLHYQNTPSIMKVPECVLESKATESEFYTLAKMNKFVVYYDPYEVMSFPRNYINLYDVLFKYKPFIKLNGVKVEDITSPSLSNVMLEAWGEKKTIFDYRNFSKEPPEELIKKHFVEYAESILKIVKQIEEQCEGWKRYLTEEQIERGLHLFYPISRYVSTVLQNYSVSQKKTPIHITPKNFGGFVMRPLREYVSSEEGDIYILDWSSMYPQIIMGLNSFEQIGDGKIIDGVLKIYGDYSTTPSTAYNLLKQLYKQKEEGDKTAKIILNSIYGLLAAPHSKYYNPVAAADITLVGRFITISTIQFLHKLNYLVFYSDTDSYFILDESKDFDRLKQVVEFLEKWFSQLFDLEITPKLKISSKIKSIRFFEDANGKLLKKIYLVEYENGDKEIKGLSTKSICPINKKIIYKYFDKILSFGGVPKSLVKKEYMSADILEFAKPIFIEEQTEDLSFGTHMLIYTKNQGYKYKDRFVKKPSEVKDVSEIDLEYYYNEIHSFILPYDNLLGFF